MFEEKKNNKKTKNKTKTNKKQQVGLVKALLYQVNDLFVCIFLTIKLLN